MEYYKSQFKVGMLVFVSACFLLFFVLSIGSFKLFHKTMDVKIYFDFVNGLIPDAPVRYSGVEIGTVKKIRIAGKEEKIPDSNKRVEVVVKIMSSVAIPRDSQASVNTLGLLGEKYIEFDSAPVTSEIQPSDLLHDGDYIVGEDLISMSKLFETGQDIIKSLDNTMGSIESIVGDDDAKKRLKNIVTNVESLTKRLDVLIAHSEEVVGGNKKDIRELVVNLKDTSKSAKVFADKIATSPSSLMWKSRDERKKQIEEKKKALADDRKTVDKYGRVVPKRSVRR